MPAKTGPEVNLEIAGKRESGLKVPRELVEISPRWLTEALGVDGQPGGPSVVGYAVEPIAEGTGFINQLFRLRLHYDSGADLTSSSLPRTVIVKLPSADPLLRSVFDKLGQNRREVMFYRELAEGAQVRTPLGYHCGMDPDSTDTILLLEDMSKARQGDSVVGCTMEEARRCIRALAGFQAQWWDSPPLERLDWIPWREAEARTYRELYDGAWNSLLAQAGDGMPRGLRSLGDLITGELHRIKARLTKPPCTIVHGDYRLDNCFFYDSPDPDPVAVADWEFCVRGRGVYDAATFISEAFSPQQRRSAESALVREYHSTLEEGGVRGYSFAECWEDYRLSMLELFVFWIVTGGYCAYEGERAQVYLRNTLERIGATISDLDSIGTIGL